MAKFDPMANASKAPTLYGIPNCDTVKKARKWLDAAGVVYHFHDFRADGLAEQQVKAWVDELGWEAIVNRRSTSWRELSDEERAAMSDAAAVTAILAMPTLIKRPLLDMGAARHVGFSAKAYKEIFG